MGKRGPKPKPNLTVVREGNPGKRPIREDLQLPPATLGEPDWAVLLPGDDDELAGGREVASAIWRRVHTRLKAAGLIADIDEDALADLGVVRAMIWIETRRWALGTSDPKRLPTLGQLRAQFVSLSTRFYLTPGDRAQVDLGGSKDDDEDFDRPADPAQGHP